MSLTQEIPDTVEQALRLPRVDRQQELMVELAVALYARGILSLGKASELVSMGKIEFGLLLGRREIPRHYGDTELDQDLKYASGESHLTSLQPRSYRPPTPAPGTVRNNHCSRRFFIHSALFQQVIRLAGEEES